ncbi:MAG: hypothetical protein PHY79_17415 [Anaerolineae bacterium]|nr:hypothetical protein [Anaerolineae bacterium]
MNRVLIRAAQPGTCGSCRTHITLQPLRAGWPFGAGRTRLPGQALLALGTLAVGGVFNPTTRCNSINHAIVLTGWDDSKGAWQPVKRGQLNTRV